MAAIRRDLDEKKISKFTMANSAQGFGILLSVYTISFTQAPLTVSLLITLIKLYENSLLCHCARHGKPKRGTRTR
jgi:hypothetical protein